MKKAPATADFFTGLVFGFDVGTASIGWAVRKGPKFLDVGVLICPEGTSELADRRKSRTQRRRLRNRSRVRDWFAAQLEERGFSSPFVMTKDPTTGAMRIEVHPKGQPFAGRPVLKPNLNYTRITDPVQLRCDAVAGKEIAPEELYVALTHLWKRRGKTQVPWKGESANDDDEDAKKEQDEAKLEKEELAAEMQAGDGSGKPFEYPCQLLLHRQQKKIKQRDETWPRDKFEESPFHLEKEFAAIIAAQAKHFSQLEGKVTYTDANDQEQTVSLTDWLLYGNTQEVIEDGKRRRVYYGSAQCAHPGVLGLRWPRFVNRGPGLDSLHPEDSKGRPLHTMLRAKPLYKEWQFEIALTNLRVQKLVQVGRKQKKERIPPPKAALEKLRIIWRNNGAVTSEDLKRWADDHTGEFDLVPKQGHLTPPDDKKGRGRYSKLGLGEIQEALGKAQAERSEPILEGLKTKKKRTMDDAINAFARTIAPPPLLRRKNNDGTWAESEDQALRKFIFSVRDPVVRHRLVLFDGLLTKLVARQKDEPPNYVVVEAVRSLALSDEDEKEREKAQKDREEKNNAAKAVLRDMGFDITEDNIRKYRLLDEIGWRCPYTHRYFLQTEFNELVVSRMVEGERRTFIREARAVFNTLEVEHMVPKSVVVCDEWYNLTVTSRQVNRDRKKEQTPYQAFCENHRAGDPEWESLKKYFADRYGEESLKYKIFSSPNPAELIDKKSELTRTAYIARCLRYVCLIRFNWLDQEGRDPRLVPGNEASQFYQVTNGAITMRLRKHWRLDEVLHRKMSDKERESLSKEERESFRLERALKNRRDHRHHALDAMVISCTLPWLAQRTVGARGWCELDEEGTLRRMLCPVFGDDGFKFKQVVEATMNEMLAGGNPTGTWREIRHHQPTQKHAKHFDTTLYGRRDAYYRDEKRKSIEPLKHPVFVARKRLDQLEPKNLSDKKPDGKGYTGVYVFSPLLRTYLTKEWENYRAVEGNWQRVRNRTIADYENRLTEARAKAEENSRFRRTVEALQKKLSRLDFMANTAFSPDKWDALLEFLDQDERGQQPKPRLPADFIEKLRHPIFNTPIESVKVQAQSPEPENYFETREGSKTYVNITGYKEARVFQKPSKQGKEAEFACWLVRPWYRNRKDGRKLTLGDHTPDGFRGLKRVAIFRTGQIIQFKHAIPGKGIAAKSKWIIKQTNVKGDTGLKAEFALLPHHQARTVVNPTTKKVDKLDLTPLVLNALMRGLGYADKDELPHSPSPQPPPAGTGEARPASH